MSKECFRIKGRLPVTEKLPESIEPSTFVSHKAKMLGQFNSRKDLLLLFKRRPRIFVKLGFRELRHSKLPGLHPFDNMAIIH